MGDLIKAFTFDRNTLKRNALSSAQAVHRHIEMVANSSADACMACRGPGGGLPGQSMIDGGRERFVCRDMAMKQGVFGLR